MSFLNIYKEATLSQLRAALEMCRIVIERCPEEFWDLEIRGHQISQVLHHGLFYTDFYINDLDDQIKNPAENYSPPELFNQIKRPTPSLSEPVENVLPKEILIEFINFISNKAGHLILNVSEKRLSERSEFEWLSIKKVEVLLYLTRHLMEHIGQVAAYVRDRSTISMKWVGKGSFD